MLEKDISNVKYELINSTLAGQKEVVVTFSYENNAYHTFYFWPNKLSDKDCLKKASKKFKAEIKSGEINKFIKKQINGTLGINKRVFKYGLISILAVTAITLTTIFTYRALSSKSKDITITLNSGIGTFDNATIKKTLTVKSGTKLNNLLIDDKTANPTYTIYNNVTVSEIFPCCTWTDESNKIIPIDYKINKNMEITAHYFNSLASLKELVLLDTTSIFFRMYQAMENENDRMLFKDFYRFGKNKILSFENDYQVDGYGYAFAEAILYCKNIGIEDTIEYFNECIRPIDNYQDQRAKTLGNIIYRLFINSEFVQKLGGLEGVRTYCNFLTEILNKINIDYTYLYQNVNYEFIHNQCPAHNFETLIQSMQEFSPYYTKSFQMEKMQYATKVIIDFFEQSMTPEGRYLALYQKTKELLEKILCE